MVAVSAMSLDLALQLVEQLGVRLGVDLAPQDLLGTGDRELRHLLAQGFLRAHDFLVDVGLRRRDDAVGLGPGLRLGFLEHLRVALLGRGDDLADAASRFRELLVRALARGLELLLTALACGEAVGDGLLAFLDGPGKRRPDELDAEPDEQGERQALRDQREVDVHPASAPSSGLANAKNMPMPSPMMNEASIRPSSRNTFACSAGIISGWRAAPSRKRLHMIPTPTQAPSAPRPTIRPMPTPV